MTATDRLTTALAPRHPETRTLVVAAVTRLADQVDEATMLGVVAALEHPAGVTSTQLCEEAQVTPRQMTYWTNAGLLEPITPHPGSGGRLMYAADQVAKAATMSRLVRLLGMSPTHAAYAADQLHALGRVRLPGLELTRRTR